MPASARDTEAAGEIWRTSVPVPFRLKSETPLSWQDHGVLATETVDIPIVRTKDAPVVARLRHFPGDHRLNRAREVAEFRAHEGRILHKVAEARTDPYRRRDMFPETARRDPSIWMRMLKSNGHMPWGHHPCIPDRATYAFPATARKALASDLDNEAFIKARDFALGAIRPLVMIDGEAWAPGFEPAYKLIDRVISIERRTQLEALHPDWAGHYQHFGHTLVSPLRAEEQFDLWREATGETLQLTDEHRIEVLDRGLFTQTYDDVVLEHAGWHAIWNVRKQVMATASLAQVEALLNLRAELSRRTPDARKFNSGRYDTNWPHPEALPDLPHDEDGRLAAAIAEATEQFADRIEAIYVRYSRYALKRAALAHKPAPSPDDAAVLEGFAL